MALLEKIYLYRMYAGADLSRSDAFDAIRALVPYFFFLSLPKTLKNK
jgi:hypothetical protein